jgi:hypothetical protein
VAWPLVCYLVLFPLHALVRRLCDDETALLSCVLYVVVPSVSLITLHTDQFLFPLLGALTLWASVQAARARSDRGAFVAGVALWVSGFFTFPLLLLAPVALALAWAVAPVSRADNEAGTSRARLRATIRMASRMAAGLAAGFVLFRLVLGYDVMARLADARRFNAIWKGWDGGAFQTLYFGWVNLLEFGLWLGIPVAALTFGRARRAIVQLAGGDVAGLGLPAVAMLLVFGYLAFFGQTKAETARLWLFMVPLCCTLAADELRTRWAGDAAGSRQPGSWVPVAGVIVLLQWLTVILTKTGQDFY